MNEDEKEDIKLVISGITPKKLTRYENEAKIQGCKLENPIMYQMYEKNYVLIFFICLLFYFVAGVLVGVYL